MNHICHAFMAGRGIWVLTLLFALATGQHGFAQQTAPREGDRIVTVMSRNVYHGVNDEIFAVPAATSFSDLLERVALVYQGISRGTSTSGPRRLPRKSMHRVLN